MHILRDSLISFAASLTIATFLTTCASAQDPGAAAAQAAQQATMQAIQINQQQIQQMQEENARANAQIQQQMADSANAAQANGPYCCFGTVSPTFSVKPGKYAQPVQVRIRDNTRGATIYYTTDGWTPTQQSAKYEGPITIDSSTQLQAIAIGPSPFFARSLVSKALYSVSAAGSSNSVALSPTVTAQNGVLPKGLPVPLVFAGSVSSKTADVGDKIELQLAEDITDGNTILVPTGASASGVITQVDRSGPGGAPGNIAFKVTALDAGGQTIPLLGSAAREGDAKLPNAAALIPVAGAFVIFRHGKDAEIAAGTPFTAHVASDISLRPH